MKKIKILLILLSLVLLMVPTAVAAEIVDSGTCGFNYYEGINVLWSLTDDGVLTISGTGAISDYSSGQPAPWDCYADQINKIVIEDGIAAIGCYAFNDLNRVTEVFLPESLYSIGEYAFEGCYRLSQISLPSGLSIIDDSAFSNCSFSSVSIPSGIQYLGYSVFADNMKLNDNGYSFSKLNTIIYYEGTREEWGNVECNDTSTLLLIMFLDNTYLEVSEAPWQNEHEEGWTDTYRLGWGRDQNGALTIIDLENGIGNQTWWPFENAFENAKHMITSVIINEGVDSIPSDIFDGCVNVTNISIPSTVESIMYTPFDNCTSLLSFEVADANPYFCDIDGVLFNENRNILIQYPCGRSGTYSIPHGTKQINSSAFANCSGLTDVTFPTSIEEISYNAFDGTTWIQNQGDFAVGNNILFRYLGDDESVIIPADVTYVGPQSFEDCLEVESVIFPETVQKIGAAAGNGTGNYELYNSPVGPFNMGNWIGNNVTILGKDTILNCIWSYDTGGWGGEWDQAELYLYGYVGSTAEAYVNPDTAWTGDNVIFISLDESGNPIYPSESEKHDTMEELTEFDYLLFSEIVYEDTPSSMEGKTVSELLEKKWDNEWNDKGITYAEAYGSIENWTLHETWSLATGFSAAEFLNSKNEAVLAFCGSRPLGFENVIDHPWDVFMDWFVNDFPMELFDMMGPQVKNALNTYLEVLMENPVDIKFTGHSLGGALADIVSAYSGYEAITFNSISAMDVAYKDYPEEMGKAFTGVDNWNITDHTNEHDILAGMYEEMVDNLINTPLKPYQRHKNTGSATSIFANHFLESIVEINDEGKADLSPEGKAYRPSKAITQLTQLSELAKTTLRLGTVGNNTFNMDLYSIYPSVAYGGNGHDTIVGGIFADTFVGGRGNDHLNGDYLNDTYIYYKGDGHDFIRDISGNDRLVLKGFSSSDVIKVVDEKGLNTIDITCNGERIVSIYKDGREHTGITLKSFIVSVDVNGRSQEYNITSYFNTRKHGSRILVGCPVDVEIIDANGNVVFTLRDGEVGNWHNEYGNFYVFEEENGEYGKAMDLVEGYSARIVGVDEGTLDVTYQIPNEGELSDAISVMDVAVSSSTVAQIGTNEKGNTVLNVDNNGDGKVDDSVLFSKEEDTPCTTHGWSDWEVTKPATSAEVGEEMRSCIVCGQEEKRNIDKLNNPFVDVVAGKFYEIPVLWAVENGVTSGMDATHFAPNDKCTRAQVVTFLWRAAGSPKPISTNNPFTDVKEGKYYYNAVLWAVENGITSGTSATTFSPDASCTRGQVATFLWRTLGKPAASSSTNPFTDVAQGKFYYDAVLWAAESGVTSGMTKTTFAPDNTCTRGQIVTFLYRALG